MTHPQLNSLIKLICSFDIEQENCGQFNKQQLSQSPAPMWLEALRQKYKSKIA